MSKVLVIGGGAAGMFAAILPLIMEMKFIFLKRTKNLERSCLSQEKGAVILQMQVIWILCLPLW